MTAGDDTGDKTVVAGGTTVQRRLEDLNQSPPSVVLLEGPAAHIGRQWPLANTNQIVGRVPECHIFVDDRSVSKSHAKFTVDGTKVSLEDTGSTNGTEINGVRMAANVPQLLKNDDKIQFGNVIFKFFEKGNLEAASMKKTFDRSQIDALTEIFNKGAFLTRSEELFKRASLTQTPLSLIVFDLDFFKKINDTYGHPAGDYVLKELSALVSKHVIRSHDFFARYGGEEFVILLAGSNLKNSTDVAERLRHTIEKHNFEFNGNKLPVTISVGVSEYDSSMGTMKDLFEKADQASYASKKGGRNRVTAA